tara:strand:+ start:1020 stop:5933 length:4914 start_codon:yes stop_codon:yes gene_type:complete
MKNIYLHGVFEQRLGSKWRLNVSSPAEAVNAIDSNTNGKLTSTMSEIIQNGDDFAIASIGDKQLNRIESFLANDEFDENILNDIFCNEKDFYCLSKDSDIHIIPVIEGEAIIGGLMAMVGKAAGALKGVMGKMSLSKTAFNILAPMAVSAIANALFPSPKVTDKTRQTKSYLFDDRPNTTRQGAPVPIGYGMLKIGSNTISYNRTNKDKTGASKNGPIETFTTYNVYDVLSEGPIEGLCDFAGNLAGPANDGNINRASTFNDNDALKSMFLNDMVIMNHPSNSLNFLVNEDDIQPQGTLGFLDTTLESRGSFFIAGESENASSSELPGPSNGSKAPPAILTGLPEPFLDAQNNGAKVFSYPITRPYTQLLKITLSPQAMFHNWTDQRTRRGFLGIGARSKVVTGTSGQTIEALVTLRDGAARIPVIYPKERGGFGGGEGGTTWTTTTDGQRSVTNHLGPTDSMSDPRPWSAADFNGMFARAMFYSNTEVFAECNSIFNLINKLISTYNSTEVIASTDHFGTESNLTFIQAVDDIYGDDAYEDQRNSIGEVLVDLISVIRAGGSAQEMSYRYYHQIMPLIKKEIQKKYGTSNRPGFKVLGADGIIYNCGEKEHSILTVAGLCTSPAGLDLHVALPYFGPSESLVMTMVRTTLEYTDPKDLREKNNKMRLSSITSADGLMGRTVKYSHPGVSCIKIPFDAVNFPQLPERNFLAKLKRVAVPENYNPVTRKYHGAWNGLFHGQTESNLDYGGIKEKDLKWTDNPAWILADILLNRRYGVGSFGFTMADIDIWKLYAAAKFCDELVETGFPLENPKRRFESTVSNQTKKQFLSTEPEQNSFTVKIEYNHLQASERPAAFSAEFNLAHKDTKYSAGRKVAFFMDDGSIEERTVTNANMSNQTITCLGPNFSDNQSIVNNKVRGYCVMQLSYPIVEPRFSANMLFKEKEEALRAVKEICTVFRTVVAYSAGKVSFASEHKKDPVMIFTDANVGTEGFSYAGSPRTSRVTACKVRYADKFDQFRSKVEYYEDSGSIDKFGFKLEEILAVGCTSRGQARRLAKFTVMAPNLENEYTTFETGLEASLLSPGSIIEISDSRRYGENINGRIKSIDVENSKVFVDKVMDDLSFYNPSSPSDNRNPVEIAILCGSGYEFVGEDNNNANKKTGLYKKMFALAQETDSFDAAEQMSMISGISRPQIAYFDGFIDNSDNSIVDLKLKYTFRPVQGTNTILSDQHGLVNGQTIRFTSFGQLPTGLEAGRDYTVSISDATQQRNSFRLLKQNQGGSLVDANIDDIGFRVKAISSAGNDQPEIPGGEHYYYITSSDEKTDLKLRNISVGAVWSIRGYARNSIESAQQYEPSDLTAIHAALGGEDIPDSLYKKSPVLGRYKILDITPNGNGGLRTVTIRQKSSTGLGFGDLQLAIDVEGFDPNAYQYSNSSLSFSWFKSFRLGGTVENGGWIKVVENGGEINFVVYKPLGANGLDHEYSLKRVHVDSDVFHISSAKTQTTVGSQVVLGQSTFDVVTINSEKYIRISNKPISESDVDNFVPGTVPTVSAETLGNHELSFNINSFKNAGRMQYRIVSVTELDQGKYKIKASEYNKHKFDLIEKELAVQKPVFPIPPQASMAPPKAPQIEEIVDLTQSG